MISPPPSRLAYIDTAKGLCIIFVVMMHATLGVEAAMDAKGFMHWAVAFAAPFRMPDFFLIAGLFLSQVIDRRWPLYLDRKVVHFLYFYVLWLTIQFAFKAPGFAAEDGWSATLALYLWSYIEPFGTLWFIYILPIFFVVSKALHDFSLPRMGVLAAAAGLHLWSPETGFLLLDEFSSRFVFFYGGFVCAPAVLRVADLARTYPAYACAALILWALTNGACVAAGISGLPLVSLPLGAAGALALVAFAALVSSLPLFHAFTWLGAHSLVIYLSFFLPMAVSRIVFLKTGIISDPGWIALLVTAAGVMGPAIFYLLIRNFAFADFLFKRPQWAILPAGRPNASQGQTLSASSS